MKGATCNWIAIDVSIEIINETLTYDRLIVALGE